MSFARLLIGSGEFLHEFARFIQTEDSGAPWFVEELHCERLMSCGISEGNTQLAQTSVEVLKLEL
jgi:hypothetical protein